MLLMTARCCYNSLENMTMNTAVQKVSYNTDHTLNWQKILHILPSDVVSFTIILEKTDHVVTALHCIPLS